MLHYVIFDEMENSARHIAAKKRDQKFMLSLIACMVMDAVGHKRMYYWARFQRWILQEFLAGRK